MSRTYSAEEKASAVALAASIGPLKAARQLGIPPRTVASWTHLPAASPIIAAAHATLAQRLASAHDEALAIAKARLHGPKLADRDLASYIRVFGEQRALAEGRATANVELHATTADAAVHEALEELSDDERDSAMHWMRRMVQANVAGEIIVIFPTDCASRLTEELVVEQARRQWTEALRDVG